MFTKLFLCADLNFTEQKSFVFDPLKLDQRSENVSFFVPRDNIVEITEFFVWTLSVNDSRVRVGLRRQIVGVKSNDGKQLIILFLITKLIYITVPYNKLRPIC